ncbi:S9 family peptidase [Variovorax paradoxus]|uniref:alpha/beta hydrolase family protein n=1 Tax=Variovorax paradoxus TaxID=34073 RepID=UPI0019317DF0|nr:alpha/beta hydrolase [Variovorax paradoxus]
MQLSTDLSHHFELLRMLGHAYYGGTDVQEVLDVASAVKPGDDEGWHAEWSRLGDRVRASADLSLSRGHRLSAAKAYLRASMYYFMCDFYLHANPEDPRIVAAGRASRTCFIAGTATGPYAVERVEIPYEQTSLPAYVIKRKGATGPRPTLIVHSGFDGTKEEIAIWPGMAAVERGYTVIAFEGPGQGEVIRERKLTFRPDWNCVVTPIVDYALQRADVDGARMALMGISLGGLLAPLAAAKEHRLRALIANGGVNDYHAIVSARIPPDLLGDPSRLETALKESQRTNTLARWGFNHGRMVFGATDALDYLEKTRHFRAADAEQIRCETLILDADHEGFFAGQPRALYDRLTCRKTYMNLTNAESAGAHCQAGAEGVGGQRIFDWLDEAMQVGNDQGDQ